MRKYHPICVTLQETRLRDRETKPPSQYKLLKSNVTRQDDHERGTSILIHLPYRYEPVSLNT